MASKDDMCTCGHERMFHTGGGGLLDRKGCAVTYCKCRGFVLDEVVPG